MRKIILYIATGFNGKIARLDGSVDWLESIPNPDNSDYGYAKFYESVDTTIQGYKTYEQIVNWEIEFPYKGLINFVLTRQQNFENNEDVEFISKSHTDFIRMLKKKSGKDIWLIGGGQINTLLLNEGLIDEIRLFVMPINLPSGIEVFENAQTDTCFTLIDSKTYKSGVIELTYEVGKSLP